MTTKAVLARFPEIKRNLLYSWVRQGWVRPESSGKGARMDFSEHEVQRIQVALQLMKDRSMSSERAFRVAGATFPENSRKTDAGPHRLRILAVEDYACYRMLIQSCIEEKYGGQYLLVFAASSQEAKEAVEHKGPFDAVIVDAMIPAMPSPAQLARPEVGVEFVEWLEGRSSPPPIGVCSTDDLLNRAKFERRRGPKGKLVYACKAQFRFSFGELLDRLIPASPANRS